MRKNELRRFANAKLNADKHGSHRDQKHRFFVINKIIHDLFTVGQFPAKWHGLTHDHIFLLIKHWKKQQIKPVTMMKYMTFLRYFLRVIEHHIEGIDNKTLGLSRTTVEADHAPVCSDPMGKSVNPIANIIFELQSKFGLTPSEAMRVIPDIHIRGHSIWLTREITSNSQDRVVPIREDKQINILLSLREVTGNDHSLMSLHGYHAVLSIYRIAMQRAGLSSTKSYRYLYAKHQFHQLSKSLSKKEATLLLMREMGLKSRTTLWGYLHE